MVMTQLCTDNLSTGDMELIMLLEGSLINEKDVTGLFVRFSQQSERSSYQGRF